MVILNIIVRIAAAITVLCVILLVGARGFAATLLGGEQIAYASGVYFDAIRLYLLDVDRGLAVNLTPNYALSSISPPVWSPDGKEIAFVSGGPVYDTVIFRDSDIMVLDLESGDFRRLDGQIASVSFPTWSPDGEYLAFVAHRTDRESIAVINAQGHDLRLFTNQLGVNAPSWSPDGETIAFATSSGIHLIERVSGNVRTLTGTLDPVVQTRAPVNPRPVWFPGGDFLAYAGTVDDRDYIYLLASDGSSLRSVTQLGDRDAEPSWSPDGLRLAFTSGSATTRHIYIVEEPGTQDATTRLVGEGFSPAWSPDGAYLAFQGMDGDIYAVDVESGKQQRLTHNDHLDLFPAWRPGLE